MREQDFAGRWKTLVAGVGDTVVGDRNAPAEFTGEMRERDGIISGAEDVEGDGR